jgi:hypothetical protein
MPLNPRGGLSFVPVVRRGGVRIAGQSTQVTSQQEDSERRSTMSVEVYTVASGRQFSEARLGAAIAAMKTGDRATIVKSAKLRHLAESLDKTVLCSRRDWVDQALRDAGLSKLDDSEVRSLCIRTT